MTDLEAIEAVRAAGVPLEVLVHLLNMRARAEAGDRRRASNVESKRLSRARRLTNGKKLNDFSKTGSEIPVAVAVSQCQSPNGKNINDFNKTTPPSPPISEPLARAPADPLPLLSFLTTEESKKEDLQISRVGGRIEGCGEEGTPKPAKAAKAAYLPDDWKPSDEVRLWALGVIGAGRIHAELDKFRDHWKAASGQNARKRDWTAAFRNWCRKAAEGPTRSAGGFARPMSINEKLRQEMYDVRQALEASIAADAARRGEDFGEQTDWVVPRRSYG